MSASATTSAEDSGLTASVTIAASPAEVWALVADLPRMGTWSPQVVKTVVLGRPVRLGTRFVNLNHQGRKHWPTTAKVVRYAPEREIAFRVTENWTVWSFQLEATEAGTQVTHRREEPDGISPLSTALTRYVLGGKESFEQEMIAGMGETLARIKAEAEARS